ncbi:Protein CBG23836, partial [Caenorhabditis briggsae]
MIACFVKKHQAIAGISRKSVIPNILLLFMFIYFVIYTISVTGIYATLNVPEDEKFELVKKKYPTYLEGFRSLPNFSIYDPSGYFVKFVIYSLVGGIAAFFTLVLVLLNISRMLRILKTKMSASTYQKHKSAIFCLLAQFSTSSVIFLPPIFFVFVILMGANGAQCQNGKWPRNGLMMTLATTANCLRIPDIHLDGFLGHLPWWPNFRKLSFLGQLLLWPNFCSNRRIPACHCLLPLDTERSSADNHLSTVSKICRNQILWDQKNWKSLQSVHQQAECLWSGQSGIIINFGKLYFPKSSNELYVKTFVKSRKFRKLLIFIFWVHTCFANKNSALNLQTNEKHLQIEDTWQHLKTSKNVLWDFYYIYEQRWAHIYMDQLMELTGKTERQVSDILQYYRSIDYQHGIRIPCQKYTPTQTYYLKKAYRESRYAGKDKTTYLVKKTRLLRNQ